MKTPLAPQSFEFKRPKADGPVLILNERSYLMAEYNQRTGKTAWQRVVAVTQREQVERWLLSHYPVGSALVTQ